MKKFTFLFLCLTTVTLLSAQNVMFLSPLRGSKSQSHTAFNKEKTAVSRSLKRVSPVLAPVSNDTLLLDEDFSAMKAGSESAIDSVDLVPNYLVNGDMNIDSKWTKVPGWTGISVHQAGGCCALYHPNFGGVLNTPVNSYYGKIKITFRAKSIGETCLLYVGIGKGSPSQPDETSSDYFAKTLTDSDGWVNCSFEIVNPYDDNNCFIQFNAYDDGALLDDIKIVRDTDYIASPPEVYTDYFTHDGFTAFWKSVKYAKDYLVTLYQFKEKGIGNETINENFNEVKYDETTGKIDSLNPNLPAGWLFNLNPDGEQMIKSGIDSTAAICFSNNDCSITTPEDGGHILNFTFYMEKLANGTKQDKAPAVIVEGWDGTGWCNLYKIFASTKIGEVIKVSSQEIADSYTGQKPDFTLYTRWRITGDYVVKNGKIGIDNITYEKTPAVDTLALKKDVVTNMNSIQFKSLDMNSEYYIKVKSRNSKGVTSEESELTHALGVAAPVATVATNVDPRGSFTANWDAEAKANEGYVVDVKKTYTATKDVTDYPVLSEQFNKVTSTGTKENPESVGNYSLASMDAYTNTVGWYGIGNILVNGMLGCAEPVQGMNAVVTPGMKLNNGDKSFRVNLKAYGTYGDTLVVQNGMNGVARVAFDNNGEINGKVSFSEGDSSTVVYFYSALSKQFLLDDVTVCQNMKQGESTSSIIERKYVGKDTLSYDFNGLDIDAECAYSYVVYSMRYYYGSETVSTASNEIFVDLTTGVRSACNDGDKITIRTENRSFTVYTPSEQHVNVCDITGRIVFSAVAHQGFNAYTVPSKGLYLINVNNKCVKIVAR